MQHWMSVAERMSSAIDISKDSKYADLIITLYKSGASFKVHKIVLSVASPVLGELIDGLPYAEQELVLPDGPLEAFHWLLKAIYGCDPPLKDEKLALKVSGLVGKYQVKTLYPLCGKWLEDLFCKETVLEVFSASYLIKKTSLVNKCLQLLLTCADSVLSSPQVTCFTPASLKFLLQQELYVKSEAVILTAVISWGRAQLPEEQKRCPVALRRQVKDILPYVRILAMTSEEIIQCVFSSGIYPPEECQAILMHKTEADYLPPLPETCSSIKSKRKCFDGLFLYHIQLPAVKQHCNSSYVSMDDEHVLISRLRVDATVALQRVHCKAAFLKTATATVRGPTNQVLYTVSMWDTKFEVPVVLDPTTTCTITGKNNNHWAGGLCPFTNKAGGVTFDGEQACCLKGMEIHYWCLDGAFLTLSL